MKTYTNSDIKILVVDDVSKNIQVIGSMLMQQAYDVSFAKSGQEALSLLRKTKYDLILLDILMPGMDGFEVCRLIRENTSTAEIPIIFLTARSDIDSVIRGFELGAQDYLTKPFKTEELLARVKTQVELKKQKEQLENINDLLEQKVIERTQALQKAYQQLGILENAKNNFLSLISHELRTPLNILNGFSEILEESLTEPDHLEALEHIRTSTEKLINLSETALLITEIQLGKYALNLQKVSISAITRDALNRYKSVFTQKNISVKNSVPDDLLVTGDHPLLLNSVVRILENAVEAAGRDGTIYIEAARQNNTIRYAISDNGPGFSEKNLNRIFEIFAKDITKTTYDGFGLGLPAVKLVMDVHGGSINLNNKTNGGAIVTLTFPVTA